MTPDLDDDGVRWLRLFRDRDNEVGFVSFVLSNYLSKAGAILQTQLNWDRVNGVDDDTQAGEQNGITAPFILR